MFFPFHLLVVYIFLTYLSSFSAPDCKRTWKNLCNARRNSINEFKKLSVSGSKAITKKPYKYGDMMSFLGNQMSPYANDGNLESE